MRAKLLIPASAIVAVSGLLALNFGIAVVPASASATGAKIQSHAGPRDFTDHDLIDLNNGRLFADGTVGHDVYIHNAGEGPVDDFPVDVLGDFVCVNSKGQPSDYVQASGCPFTNVKADQAFAGDEIVTITSYEFGTVYADSSGTVVQRSGDTTGTEWVQTDTNSPWQYVNVYQTDQSGDVNDPPVLCANGDDNPVLVETSANCGTNTGFWNEG
jgi:hypothetical protein